MPRLEQQTEEHNITALWNWVSYQNNAIDHPWIWSNSLGNMLLLGRVLSLLLHHTLHLTKALAAEWANSDHVQTDLWTKNKLTGPACGNYVHTQYGQVFEKKCKPTLQILTSGQNQHRDLVARSVFMWGESGHVKVQMSHCLVWCMWIHAYFLWHLLLRFNKW